jgi:FKBP-type peptidyl-prolyl cis-trans isomerase
MKRHLIMLVCLLLSAAPLVAGAAENPAEKNQKEGEAFLAANGKKAGVKTLPSGLQYTILKEGSGKQPAATDTVTVHYKGTLINGTEFDSSYKGGRPLSFPLNQVIKGWTEGVQLMKEGAKYEFMIPSKLAYGARGAPGGSIPPNSTLIFEIELISVK